MLFSLFLVTIASGPHTQLISLKCSQNRSWSFEVSFQLAAELVAFSLAITKMTPWFSSGYVIVNINTDVNIDTKTRKCVARKRWAFRTNSAEDKGKTLAIYGYTDIHIYMSSH